MYCIALRQNFIFLKRGVEEEGIFFENPNFKLDVVLWGGVFVVEVFLEWSPKECIYRLRV